MADGAGGLVALHAASQAVGTRGRYKAAPFCIAGGLIECLWGGASALYQSAGRLSQIGRCFTFADSADGCVRADALGWVVVTAQTEEIDGKPVAKAVPDRGGTICGHDICQ